MQSICNKVHLLESLIQDNFDLDIICISESWLNKDKINLLKVDGYTVSSSFCRDKHEGGGVCTLIKETIEYRERMDINLLSLEMIIEMCAIELPKYNMLVINLYCPNSRRETEAFYSTMDKLLNLIEMKDSRKNIIIGGDFNVDFLTNSNEKNRLSNILLSHNFRQKINEPTRITATCSTCIDLLFTNFVSKDMKASVMEFGFSDHMGLLCSMPQNSKQLKQFFKSKRVFNQSNVQNFKNELSNINWDVVFRQDMSINENYNTFKNILQKSLNKHIPSKQIKIKSKVNYLSLGLKTSCRYKRFLKPLISKCKNENLKQYYKSYCKILRKSINTS